MAGRNSSAPADPQNLIIDKQRAGGQPRHAPHGRQTMTTNNTQNALALRDQAGTWFVLTSEVLAQARATATQQAELEQQAGDDTAGHGVIIQELIVLPVPTFNPQPDPPGFNPQPDPPGFNPQPDPPGKTVS